MTIAAAWNATEIDTGIGLYLVMRVLVEQGQPFNKRALIREQTGENDDAATVETHPLIARSRQSVEMKLMNVTACLEKIGRRDLSMADNGYKPLNSYQGALLARVTELVDGYTLPTIEAAATAAAS